MSDVPAAAWWSTAFLLVWSPRRLAAFVAGLATGVAILTRPNLVPLAIVVGGVLLLGMRSRHERALHVQRVLLFAGPSVLACAVVAYLNTHWYGSPLSSGYGTLLGVFFRWDHFWPNVVNYTRWTLDSQGPFSLLLLVGFVTEWRVARRTGEPMTRWFGISLAATVYACYAFYLPLDTWWSLRLLFPAFPILFIFAVAGGFAVIDRFPQRWHTICVVLLVAGVTAHAMTFGRSRSVFNQDSELRYEKVGRYINDHLPSRAVFITMLHSGSVRYYSGRMTIRYDWIPLERFEAIVAHLRDRGYSPFLLIDDEEDAPFRNRFSGTPSVTALGSPQVRVSGVSLYSLSDSHSTGYTGRVTSTTQ